MPSAIFSSFDAKQEADCSGARGFPRAAVPSIEVSWRRGASAFTVSNWVGRVSADLCRHWRRGRKSHTRWVKVLARKQGRGGMSKRPRMHLPPNGKSVKSESGSQNSQVGVDHKGPWAWRLHGPTKAQRNGERMFCNLLNLGLNEIWGVWSHFGYFC